MVCVGIAGATEFALYRYLVGELDGQLLQIAQRSSMMDHRPPMPPMPPMPPPSDARPQLPLPDPGPGPEFLDAPGQPIGMVAAVVKDGIVTKAGELKIGRASCRERV